MISVTLLFLVVLAVLIFVHELGHFLFAKMFGIRVDEFALGFGPKIISKEYKGCVYSLNAIPFGGYVKIFGENPEDMPKNDIENKSSFITKPKWQQILVLFGGILFNFIFAYILVSISFVSGVPASVESYPQYADKIRNERIVITHVESGSPAEKFGLKSGDVILENSLSDVQEKIDKSNGDEVTLQIERGGVIIDKKLIAEKGIVEGKYAVGIAMDKVGTLKLNIFQSLIEGLRLTLHIIVLTIQGIYDLIMGIFNGTSSLKSVTGPVGIAGLIGDAAKMGFAYLLMFTAFISINLGVLNFVPFPALDGGRILFVIIEAVIRRPIKPVIANSLNVAGFALLILLMIIVTYRDIAKWFVN